MPAGAVPPVVLRGAALAWAVVIVVFGARKVWWSLGDLVNFSGASARRGIGDIVVGLRERGLDPLVIAVRHRGLEHVIPRGSTRGITSGHLIEACWAECQLDREGSDGRDQDAQSIADAVRSRVASLMPGKPIRSREGG